MFWDGTRWIDERPRGVTATTPKSRTHDRRPVALVIIALIALSVPFTLLSAEPTSAAALTTKWKADYSVTTVQEASSRIHYKGKWFTTVHRGYSNDRARSSNAKSASATMRFQGTGIGWAGPKGPTRGKAKVYVDGKLMKTVNLWQRHYDPDNNLFQKTWGSVGSHTIKIVVVGTAGHPTVAIDALVIRGAAKVKAASDTAGQPAGQQQPPADPGPSDTPGDPAPNPDGLTVSNVSVSSVTQNGAMVKWSVSENATGQVEYGKSTGYGSVSAPEDSFDYSSHSQQLSGLTAGTQYHFRVHSVDAGGDSVYSQDQTFTTAATSAPATPAPATPAPATPAPATPAPATPAPATPAPATPAPAPATGCSTLQARIDGASAGSVLDLTGCTYSATGTINKKLTLRGAKINAPAGKSGLVVTGDDVVVDQVTITGAQATNFVSGEKCISVPGSSSNTVDRLTIKDSTIRRCGYGGIYLSFAVSAKVDGNTIEDSVYAGILMASVRNSTISNNTVRRVGVSGAGSNSWNAYGITATYESSTMSSDVLIEGNTVETVPTWHGLDTHGGIRITYRDNTIRAARRAAFLTSGPTDVVFDGNTIIAPTSAQQAACPAGAPAAYCTDVRGITLVSADGATVKNNTGSGWGDRWLNDMGSSGVVLSNNTVK